MHVLRSRDISTCITASPLFISNSKTHYVVLPSHTEKLSLAGMAKEPKQCFYINRLN